MKNILIVGASGLVGSSTLRRLISSQEVERVYSLVRKSSGETNPKVREIIIDFESLLADSGVDQIKAAMQSQGFDTRELVLDAIVCCLGTTIKKAKTKDAFRKVDYEYVLGVANWGVKNLVPHFLVVSAMGANPKSLIFYNRVKGEMESAVIAAGFLSVDIFRPSLLLGPRQEVRIGEVVGERVFKLVDPILKKTLPNLRAIQADTVAEAIVANVLRPSRGLKIHLSGEMQIAQA